MKSLIFYIIISAQILFNLGCQAAYRVNPNSLPKKLQPSITLEDADQQAINFTDIYQNHKATVVIFWQTGCPCVKRYQERINRLFTRYISQDVAFFYISSNTNESFESVKKEYKNRTINLPLLRDNGGALAKILGAKGTPTAAIINPAGEMIFIGWIDNERNEKETGRTAYLENALTDLLNNNPIKNNTSPMFGCEIR